MTSVPSVANPELCPTCAGSDWDILFPSRGFDIGRCRGCGLVRTLHATLDGIMQYPPFDQKDTALVRLMRFAVSQLLRERVAVVRKIQATGRLLDVGCGSGGFARMAHQAGFDVVGVEPFSLGHPVQEPGLKLIRATFEDCAPTLGQFDVITMWHVLEHLSDPLSVLRPLLDHLKPGGRLVVSVPNFKSWQGRLFRGGWFHLDPPRHVTHFDRDTLGALFDRLDLRVEHERTFHLEYGPSGWLQSSLNLLLPRKNFLFELVKDRGALAQVPAAEIALNLAASMGVAAAVLGPTLIAELLSSLVGAGSVVTLVACRR